jgi:hypothetical protein
MRQDAALDDRHKVAGVEFGVESNSPVSNERDDL